MPACAIVPASVVGVESVADTPATTDTIVVPSGMPAPTTSLPTSPATNSALVTTAVAPSVVTSLMRRPAQVAEATVPVRWNVPVACDAASIVASTARPPPVTPRASSVATSEPGTVTVKMPDAPKDAPVG